MIVEVHIERSVRLPLEMSVGVIYRVEIGLFVISIEQCEGVRQVLEAHVANA